MYPHLARLFEPSAKSIRDRFATAHATSNSRRHVNVVERSYDYARPGLVVFEQRRLGSPPNGTVLDFEPIVDARVVVAVLDASRVAKVDGELAWALLLSALLLLLLL